MKAFENVMGYGSLKQELMEIVDIMQNEELYQNLGARCPNGLLLYGDPGLGKTLIANSFIEASGRPAIICRKNASEQSFIDSISESFNEALEKAPSIILLDDMDKFANDDRSHKDSEAFVTIQSCIDTVKGASVFVLATANDIDKLPDSLVRTGRFDHKIELSTPSDEDSEKIIEHYLDGKDLSSEVDIKLLSSLFRGSSCSTLETIINQAGIIAGFKRESSVSMRDMIQSYLQIEHHIPKGCLDASESVDLYAKDGSADVLWHEAGHAAMAEIIAPGSVRIALASSKGGANKGFVTTDYSKSGMDQLSITKSTIMVSLASAAAMDVTFGRTDPGTEQDISDALRAIDDYNSDLGGFAGLSMAVFDYRPTSHMGERREIANSAIAELFYQEAKELLCQNRDFLEAIAKAFSEKVVLTSSDIAVIRESLESKAA